MQSRLIEYILSRSHALSDNRGSGAIYQRGGTETSLLAGHCADDFRRGDFFDFGAKV